MEIDIPLLPHQLEFVGDVDSRFLGLVAGYGSGKTFAFVVKGIYLAFLNAGFTGAMLEPTNAMAADILVPQMNEMLNEFNIPHSFKASPYPTYKLHFEQGTSTILIRSAENYPKLVGLNLAWYGVDEVDTIKKTVAWKMWRVLQSRLRSRAPNIQGFTTSTPEGFSFLYEYFVKEVQEAHESGKVIADRQIIHAKSTDNPYLDPEYIPSLLADYPPQLVKSYVEGKFVNLLSGNVYYAFDRELNGTIKTLSDFDDADNNVKASLHIGMDFNVNKCCGIVHVIDKDPKTKITTVYAIDEFTGVRDTTEMIEQIKQRYPDREIVIYPDASGRKQNTATTTTDLRLLKNEFTVKVDASNPRVRDRINSMNAMFCNAEGQRRYYVNTKKCPHYVEAIETQAYNDKGEPDKTHDQDHPVDAGGYFIHKMFPIKSQRDRIKIVGW